MWWTADPLTWVRIPPRPLFLLIFLVFSTPSFAMESHPKVLINEIMYDPLGKEPDNEWIELYNMENKSVDLSSWYITDDLNFSNPEREGSYRFPEGTEIPAKSYLVIAYNGSTFFSTYGFYPDFEIINSSSVVEDMVEVKRGLSLSNYGDDLHLFSEDGVEIDRVWYGKGGDVTEENPAIKVREGNSLARYRNKDSNIPRKDFYEESTPSPGRENKAPGIVSLDLFPTHIPKVHRGKYGLPFAIKVSIRNFDSFHLKVSLSKNHSLPTAAQVWNGKRWIYSGRYFLRGNGNWSGWVVLRLNSLYKGYALLKNSSEAYLIVKVKNDRGKIVELDRKVKLFDIGKEGGVLVGVFEEKELRGSPVLLKRGENIVSIYISENNSVDEGYPRLEGYYKLPAPSGEYRLVVLGEKDAVLLEKDNVKVKGYLDFTIYCGNKSFEVGKEDKIYIYNRGSLEDKYIIVCKGADVNQRSISLKPGEGKKITITPRERKFSVIVYSSRDPSLRREMALKAKHTCIKVKWVKILRDGKEARSCYRGEILTLKAFIRNEGAPRKIKLAFRLDNETILERDYSIKKYRYPSIKLDTSSLMEGWHRVDVLINSSVRKSVNFFVKEPNLYSPKILIVELCPNDPFYRNEYISIYNLSPYKVNLSNFYITSNPQTRKDLQRKLFLPPIELHPFYYLNISYNASAYFERKGTFPDFEYGVDSEKTVPNLKNKGFRINDNEGIICIKDRFNRTIDAVVYGNAKVFSDGWKGEGIDAQNMVLRRREKSFNFLDTNSSEDWVTEEFHKNVWCTIISKQNLSDVLRLSDEVFLYLKYSPDENLEKGTLTTISSRKQAVETITELTLRARRSIHIVGFHFANWKVIKSLINASLRGVRVKVLGDYSRPFSYIMKEYGIETKIKSVNTSLMTLILDNRDIYFISKDSIIHVENKSMASDIIGLFSEETSKPASPMTNTLFILSVFIFISILILREWRR